MTCAAYVIWTLSEKNEGENKTHFDMVLLFSPDLLRHRCHSGVCGDCIRPMDYLQYWPYYGIPIIYYGISSLCIHFSSASGTDALLCRMGASALDI